MIGSKKNVILESGVNITFTFLGNIIYVLGNKYNFKRPNEHHRFRFK